MSSPLSTASLTSHVVAIAPGDLAVAAHWMGELPCLALADGHVALIRDGDVHRVAAHPEGGVLVAAGGPARLVTGGDDGRVVETRADGSCRELAVAANSAWIDAIALH